MRPLLLRALPVVMALAAAAAAEQTFVDAARDNTLFEDTSNYRSNGSGEGLFSGRTLDGELRRALIAFDVAAALPAGATITAVQLQLNVSRIREIPDTASLHRVTRDWGEGASVSTERGGGTGVPAESGDATWAHTFFDTATWTTPGGDFDPQPSASIAIGGTGLMVWGSTAQMVADVQGWLDAPETDFGWIVLTAETNDGGAKRFDSREFPDENLRPLLLVTWEGTPVAERTWSATKALFR